MSDYQMQFAMIAAQIAERLAEYKGQFLYVLILPTPGAKSFPDWRACRVGLVTEKSSVCWYKELAETVASSLKEDWVYFTVVNDVAPGFQLPWAKVTSNVPSIQLCKALIDVEWMGLLPADFGPPEHCYTCQQYVRTKLCPRCLATQYCSKRCRQKDYWTQRTLCHVLAQLPCLETRH